MSRKPINKGFADNIETWKAVFTLESGLRMVFTDERQQPKGNDLANAMLVRPMHNGWKLEKF